MKKVQIPVWVVISLPLVMLIPLVLLFIEHFSIGSKRHALNYIEASKDDFFRRVQATCPQSSFAEFVVQPKTNEYMRDDGSFGDGVYRYIVFHDSLLRSDKCLAGVLLAATQTNYAMRIEFIANSKTRTAVFFSKGVQ